MRTTCLFPKVFFFLCVFVFMSASFFVFFSSVERWGGVVVDRLLRLLVGSASRQKYCQDRSLAVTPSGKPVMQAMKPFSVTHPCFFVCFSSAYKKNHSNVNASNDSTNRQKKKKINLHVPMGFFSFFFLRRGSLLAFQVSRDLGIYSSPGRVLREGWWWWWWGRRSSSAAASAPKFGSAGPV